MQITQFPTKNFFPNTGKKSFVIIHGTAGGSSALAIAQYFKDTEGSPNPVSTHYIIGLAGEIIQCVAETDGAFGNGIVNNPNWKGNPNYYTISIEHVKVSKDNSDDLTIAQKASSFALTKDICLRNNISMHRADFQSGITGHYSIDPVNKSGCPGTYPWDDLWIYLASGGGNINLTTNQLSMLNDIWDSVLKNMVVGPAPRGTGIYQNWLDLFLQGKFMGPPLTHEYVGDNGYGKLVVIQQFARAYCIWDGGPSWYV